MYPDAGYKRAHAQSVCTRPFFRVGRGLGTRLRGDRVPSSTRKTKRRVTVMYVCVTSNQALPLLQLFAFKFARGGGEPGSRLCMCACACVCVWGGGGGGAGGCRIS